MARQAAVCFLFFALGHLGLGARTNHLMMQSSTQPDAESKKWCETEIKDFALLIGFRISLFLGPATCGGKLAPRVPGKPPALSEEGYDNICKPSCTKLLRDDQDESPSPDTDMIQEKCTDDLSLNLIKEAKTALPLLEYLTDEWSKCSQAEPIEDDGSDSYLKPDLDDDNLEPWEIDDHLNPDLDGDESPSVEYPEIDEHNVPPPTRSRVQQIQLAYKLNNAFANRTEANCDTLITVFREFDNRHVGRLTLEKGHCN